VNVREVVLEVEEWYFLLAVRTTKIPPHVPPYEWYSGLRIIR
jgi:hypothetical protein